MSCDAGRHQSAQALFVTALHAASEAGDKALGARILTRRGSPRRAVRRSRALYGNSRGRGATRTDPRSCPEL